MKIGIEYVYLNVFNYYFNFTSYSNVPFHMIIRYTVSVYEDFQTRLLIMEWACSRCFEATLC